MKAAKKRLRHPRASGLNFHALTVAEDVCCRKYSLRLHTDVVDIIIRVGVGMVNEADTGGIRGLGQPYGLLPGRVPDPSHMRHVVIAECAVVEKEIGVVDE